MRGAVLPDQARVDPDDAMAESSNLIELVADQDDGAAGAGHVAHLAQAFLLEIDVANGEHLVHQKNLRFEMGGDGKGEADVHTGGIMLHGCVDEFFELGESNDFIKFACDFALGHAQNGTAKKSVFAAREFRMEAGADFEQATNASANLRPSSGRFCNAREDLQQGSLAGTVAADESEHFAFADFEGNIFQGPKSFIFGTAQDGQGGFQHAAQMITEERALLKSTAMVALAETLAMDDDCAH